MGCLFFFVVFAGFPLLEIVVMGRVAAQIGFWDTVVLLILSAVFGSYFARHQGAIALSRIQQCLGEGRQPTVEMIDGLLIFLGGLLFVFPGFLSDILGLLLLFPLTRWLVRFFVVSGFKTRVRASGAPARESQQKDPKVTGGMDRAGAVDAEVVE